MQRKGHHAKQLSVARVRMLTAKFTKRYFATRGYPVTGILVFATLIAFHCLGPRVQGQSGQPSPVPKLITIDVAKSLSEPFQYRFDKAPPAEASLEIKGDGKEWRFVQFSIIPDNISLLIRGNARGYQDAEALKDQTWYPFKNSLPLTLKINQNARPPVELLFWTGSPNTDGDKAQLKSVEDTPEAVRQFTESHGIKADSRGTLRLMWDVSAPPPSSPTPIPPPPPESFFDDPVIILFSPIFWVIVALLVIVFYLMFAKSGYRLRKRIKHKIIGKRKVHITEGQWGTPPASASQRNNPDTAVAKRADQGNADEQRWYRSHPTVYYPEGKNPPSSAATASQTPPPQTGTPSSGGQPSLPKSGQGQSGPVVDERKLQELKDKVEEISKALEQKVDRDAVSTIAHTYTDSGLSHLQIKLRDEFNTKIEELISRMGVQVRELSELIATQQTELHNEQQQRRQEQQQFREGHEKADNLILEQVIAVERLLREELQKLKGITYQPGGRDSFYDKVLGIFLGENVEALKDGNFDELVKEVGESLNQFFQEQVPRADSLQELRKKAEDICAALEAAVERMYIISKQAQHDIDVHVQRAKNLVSESEKMLSELTQLQTQLESRQVTVETNLRIPISAHSSARRTFLDELGAGIKREIDKLSAPQAYFERELERLATSEIVAVVEICDKKVTPPGTDDVLEGHLKKLFQLSDLLEILPKTMNPSKTVEQDIVEMIQGHPGDSLKIAEVISRGFYYGSQENKALLRKAEVKIYR